MFTPASVVRRPEADDVPVGVTKTNLCHFVPRVGQDEHHAAAAAAAECHPKRDARQGTNSWATFPATISPVASRPTTGAITTPACMTAR